MACACHARGAITLPMHTRWVGAIVNENLYDHFISSQLFGHTLGIYSRSITGKPALSSPSSSFKIHQNQHTFSNCNTRP
jgi:hypothetical protein